jgi:hypothetical protein
LAATALHNPSLSYLAPESAIDGAAAATAAEGPGPYRRLSNKNRNFSWDEIGVKAYHVMDVDEMRSKVPADPGPGKARKKLFHFPMDDDE